MAKYSELNSFVRKKIYIFAVQFADVAKLVDALDLGSSAARRGGSSPFIRTKKTRIFSGFFYMQIFNEICGH